MNDLKSILIALMALKTEIAELAIYDKERLRINYRYPHIWLSVCLDFTVEVHVPSLGKVNCCPYIVNALDKFGHETPLGRWSDIGIRELCLSKERGRTIVDSDTQLQYEKLEASKIINSYLETKQYANSTKS